MITVNGSQATGRDIMRHPAPKIKCLVMELGEYDSMIVMADADLDHAAHFAVAAGFENSGQMYQTYLCEKMQYCITVYTFSESNEISK